MAPEIPVSPPSPSDYYQLHLKKQGPYQYTKEVKSMPYSSLALFRALRKSKKQNKVEGCLCQKEVYKPISPHNHQSSQQQALKLQLNI